MFLASLAFAAGIIAPNLAWRAPHVWLIAFLVAAACVCVLYGWRARSPAFPFAAMILARRRLLLAWLGRSGAIGFRALPRLHAAEDAVASGRAGSHGDRLETE
jgi:hypothetical protein